MKQANISQCTQPNNTPWGGTIWGFEVQGRGGGYYLGGAIIFGQFFKT